MLCQKCHKNLATVRYAEVVSGKVTDLHLCSECLAKHQETAAAGFELANPVASTKRGAPGGELSKPARPRRTCKSCGTQLVTVVDTGRVGCTACYSSFADEVEPLLQGLHGSVHHIGKSPHVSDARTNLRAALQTKRALLRTAIRDEHYEEAAGLRDSIRQIEIDLGMSERDGQNG